MKGLISWSDALLRSFSSIVFSSRRRVGLILLISTFNEPQACITGILAVVLALAFSRLMGFAPELWSTGFLSYNALLCALGISHLYTFTWQIAPVYIFLVIAASVSTVALTLFLNSIFRTYLHLPILSLPFIFVAVAVDFGVIFISGHPLIPPGRTAVLENPSWFSDSANILLSSIGNLFFQNNSWSGLLVLVTILIESRISFLLAIVGLAAGYWITDVLTFGDAMHHMGYLGFNFMLTMMMLAGILLVPGFASLIYGVVAVAVSALVSIAFEGFFRPSHIPPLAIPFNVSVLLMFYVLRLRTSLGAPFVVDFISGTPEENLHYFQNRLKRLGQSATIPMRLPFLGLWTVTQPPDSEPTHQPPWQHAWDFEVLEDGKAFRNSGKEPKDYFAYDLPVVSPASGTVVHVVNDVPDNPIGEFNAKQNWGNLVMLYHGVGIYSLVCHLKPDSVQVKVNDYVKEGQLIGRCGNSGRSPIPHLHFHVQRSPQINSPTCPSDFARVIEEIKDEQHFRLRFSPAMSARVQNFLGDESLTSFLKLHVGTEYQFDVNCDSEMFAEKWKVQIDLYSNLFVESDRGAKLYFLGSNGLFTAFSFFGNRRSALYEFFIGASRIPFNSSELNWSDQLPARYLIHPAFSLMTDLLDPFGEPLKYVTDSRIMRDEGREGEWMIITRLSRSLLGARTQLGREIKLSLSSEKGIVSIMSSRGNKPVLTATTTSSSQKKSS